jgi:hypothetical protein
VLYSMELYTYMPRYVIPVEVFVKLFKQVKECTFLVQSSERMETVELWFVVVFAVHARQITLSFDTQCVKRPLTSDRRQRQHENDVKVVWHFHTWAEHAIFTWSLTSTSKSVYGPQVKTRLLTFPIKKLNWGKSTESSDKTE